MPSEVFFHCAIKKAALFRRLLPDRVPFGLPGVISAFQRPDVYETHVLVLCRHPGGRGFAGSAAVEDEVLILGEIVLSGVEFAFGDGAFDHHFAASLIIIGADHDRFS